MAKNILQRFSLLSFFLSAIIIVLVALWYPKWEKPGTEATLSWDVMGYYLYLPATFIYDDLDQLAFKDSILNKYRPTNSFYQATLHPESGNYVMKYAIGLAVLYSPFFFLGHAYALLTDYPPDGFSLPYQAAISWGSIFIALLGLWFCRKVLKQYFDEVPTGLSLISIAIGSNFLNYAAIDGAMTHVWGFTLIMILIWATIQWHQKPSFRYSFLIAFCIGFAALIRPTNIIACLIPILWGIQHWTDYSTRLALFQAHWGKLVFTILSVALIGMIQLGYWKLLAGDWIYYTYNEQGFSWFKPHVKNVLISYRKGWLVYTPIMLLALIGFSFLYRKYRPLFWCSLIYFVIHFYIVSAWDVWGYGGAFGQRAMIEAYAILALPMAAFYENILLKNWQKWLTFAFAAFSIWLNIFQTWQAHGHGFETESMTKAYYWRIFGNTNVTHLDRKLLDTKEDYQGERSAVKGIYLNDFETMADSTQLSKTHSKSGVYALKIDKNTEFSTAFIIPKAQINGEWLRVSADFYTPQKEWDVWKMTQLIVRFEKGDDLIKNRIIRVQRHIGERQWQANWSDMRIPKKDFDHVKIYFWNSGGQKDLFVDDLKVETYTGD
jgi:hypothetical protein